MSALNPLHILIVGVGVGVGVGVAVGVGVGVGVKMSHSNNTSNVKSEHGSEGVGVGRQSPTYIIVSSKSGQIELVGFDPKK
jgi:hypothetical protein